jgi:hypothetical protein
VRVGVRQNGRRKFRQSETPHLPRAFPDCVGGNLAGTGHLQNTTPGDHKEFCCPICIHKGFNFHAKRFRHWAINQAPIAVSGLVRQESLTVNKDDAAQWNQHIFAGMRRSESVRVLRTIAYLGVVTPL